MKNLIKESAIKPVDTASVKVNIDLSRTAVKEAFKNGVKVHCEAWQTWVGDKYTGICHRANENFEDEKAAITYAADFLKTVAPEEDNVEIYFSDSKGNGKIRYCVDGTPEEVAKVITALSSTYEEPEENAVSEEVQEEVKAEENVITTTDLETKLNAVKAAKEVQVLSNASAKKIVIKRIFECYKTISKCEDELWDIETKHEALMAGLNEQAAALEAEISNRKIIDAYAESLVTAEAIEASVQAEENAAIMAREVTPLTFDAQRFDEEEKEMLIAENAATVDTAITEITTPPIDEDAEFDAETKKMCDKYNKIASRIEEVDSRIADLEAQLNVLKDERAKLQMAALEDDDRQRQRDILNDFIKNNIVDTDTEITVKDSDVSFKPRKLRATMKKDGKIYITLGMGTSPLALYSSIKPFKAAIRGLAAAIERGDEVFTFPADDAENTASA